MILLQLFLSFFKVGALTFGGGYAMFPLIEEEVLKHGWMTSAQLVDFIAISESTPGSLGVNISTYVGTVTAGIPGAFFATFGVVLPSFIVIIAVAVFYEAFKKSRTIKGLMSGLKPAVIGLIGSSALTVFKTVFLDVDLHQIWCSAFIVIMSYLFYLKKSHPVTMIIAAAVAGILFGTLGFI